MRHFSLPGNTAVHIADIVAGSPAALAGVQTGDRMVALDGLQCTLDASLIGRECELQLLRRSSVIKTPIRPIEMPLHRASGK
ncbi:MAG: PDZ domain-containing protein [Steroidobacteraceae bacterium]